MSFLLLLLLSALHKGTAKNAMYDTAKDLREVSSDKSKAWSLLANDIIKVGNRTISNARASAYCNHLKTVADEKGYVSIDMRRGYSMLGCTQMGMLKDPSIDGSYLTGAVHTIRMWVNATAHGEDLTAYDEFFSPESSVTDGELLQVVFFHFCPLLFGLMAMLISSRCNGFIYYVLMAFYLLLSLLLYGGDWLAVLHIVTVAFMSATQTMGKEAASVYAMSGLSILSLAVLILTMSSLWLQTFVVIIMMALVATAFGTIWSNKYTQNHTALPIIATMGFMVLRVVAFFESQLFMTKPSFKAFKLIVGCVFPHGQYGTWLVNSNEHVKLLVSLFGPHFGIVRVYCLGMLLTFASTVAVNFFIGLFCIHRRGRKLSADDYTPALIIGFCDCFTWLYVLWEGFFNYSRFRRNDKRISYGILMFLRLLADFYFAWDLLALRVIFWILYQIFDGDTLRMTSLLAFSLINGSPPRKVYNQRTRSFTSPGSNAWMKTDTLNDLSRHSVIIEVSYENQLPSGERGHIGSGMISRSLSGHYTLTTVDHVLRNAHRITVPGYFNAIHFDTRQVSRIGVSASTDPVVEFRTSIPCSEDIGTLSTLSGQQVRTDATHLMAVGVDKETHASFLTFINSFHVTGSTVLAAINIRHGDSGTPVYGVLKDGTVGFVGAISAGTHDDHQGNVVSLAVCPNRKRTLSNEDPTYYVFNVDCADHVVGALNTLVAENLNEVTAYDLLMSGFTEEELLNSNVPKEEVDRAKEEVEQVKKKKKHFQSRKEFKKEAGDSYTSSEEQYPDADQESDPTFTDRIRKADKKAARYREKRWRVKTADFIRCHLALSNVPDIDQIHKLVSTDAATVRFNSMRGCFVPGSAETGSEQMAKIDRMLAQGQTHRRGLGS